VWTTRIRPIWAIRSPGSTTGHPERTGFDGSEPDEIGRKELDEIGRTELGGSDAGGTERGPDMGLDSGPSSETGFRSSLIEIE
jgi:hypothetical protein